MNGRPIQTSTRAGQYAWQPSGYWAFVPAHLPPDPALAIEGEMLTMLAEAQLELGRLDGVAELLPNDRIFSRMYIRKEAVVSSQIEGTQASLAEVLEKEAEVLDPLAPADVDEVMNYVHTLKFGIARLEDLPISLRLITELHERLLSGTRGQEANPGEFRRSQNWIGAGGSTLANARFVPPAVTEMKMALGELELFLHRETGLAPLVQIGLAHAQFETIHPFLDGNGRVGRLLIALLLAERQILRQPLLYLSVVFKENQWEYYERLQAVRDAGDWEGWMRFFLRSVAVAARDAAAVARQIVALREADRAKIVAEAGRSTADALTLLEALFENPVVTINRVQDAIGKEFPAASRLVQTMEKLGILVEKTGQARNRVFVYDRYFRLFDEGPFRRTSRVVAERPAVYGSGYGTHYERG